MYLHQCYKINLHKPRDTVHPHHCLNIAEILYQSVRPKLMVQIESALSMIQNELYQSTRHCSPTLFPEHDRDSLTETQPLN